MGSKDIENELRLIEERFSTRSVPASVKPLHESVEAAAVESPHREPLRLKVLEMERSLQDLHGQLHGVFEILKTMKEG